MVQITYNPREHFLCAVGHADSAEAGHDLVCAAVSAIMYLLVSFVQKEENSYFELNHGKAVAFCRPADGRQEITREFFQTVFDSFLLLAQTYPKNVSVHVV